MAKLTQKDIVDYLAIDREPGATVRKFRLIKRFRAILPPDVKTLSAADIAVLILEQIGE